MNTGAGAVIIITNQVAAAAQSIPTLNSVLTSAQARAIVEAGTAYLEAINAVVREVDES